VWQHVQLHPPIHSVATESSFACNISIYFHHNCISKFIFPCCGLSCSFESSLHACRTKAFNLSNSPFHSSDTRKNLGPKNLVPGPLPMIFAWRLRHTQIKKKSGTYPYPLLLPACQGDAGISYRWIHYFKYII